ncbi:hypothetical protein HON52_02805 [Candidatus Uhrbacteria bacterium]|jgi:photosystem II stability/assembly factor-like uncharacterized protein|nr:hypothetical protein [Candidatus Uhrbacteria bacterium]
MKLFQLLFSILFLTLIPFASYAAGWSVVEKSPIPEFNSGAFLDDVGYTVGTNGSVFVTFDGGVTWAGSTGVGTQGSYSGFSVNLNGALVFDNGSVSIFGKAPTDVTDDASRIIRSTDSGYTWSLVFEDNLGIGVDFYDGVKLADSSALIVGSDRIVKTEDSGLSWMTMHYSDEALMSISGLGDQYIAVGDEGLVLLSQDKGDTWEAIELPGSDEDYVSVDIIDNDTFVLASQEWIYWSDDAGESWDLISGGPPYVDIRDIDFYDSSNGVLATEYDGPYLNDAYVFITSDGGMTWEPMTLYDGDGAYLDIHDIQYSGEGDLYGFGESGIFYIGYSFGGYYEYVFTDWMLVKTLCDDGAEMNDPCRAVYYVDQDGLRHAFPNEQVFYSWSASFDDVVSVTGEYMASLPLGQVVTYHPESQMIKFPSSPIVYAVDVGRELIKINDEYSAELLYGDDWSDEVHDVSDAFYSHYIISEREIYSFMCECGPACDAICLNVEFEQEVYDIGTMSEVLDW